MRVVKNILNISVVGIIEAMCDFNFLVDILED